MLIAKTLEHQLRRVALPAVHRAVTLQLAINDAGEPVQLRPLHGHRPPDNPPEPRTLTSYARYRAKSRNAAQPPTPQKRCWRRWKPAFPLACKQMLLLVDGRSMASQWTLKAILTSQRFGAQATWCPKDPGLSTIRIKVDLDVDGATDAEAQDVIGHVANWSPVLNTLQNATPIAIEKRRAVMSSNVGRAFRSMSRWLRKAWWTARFGPSFARSTRMDSIMRTSCGVWARLGLTGRTLAPKPMSVCQ